MYQRLASELRHQFIGGEISSSSKLIDKELNKEAKQYGKTQRLIVVGPPGSGKSTFIHQLKHCYNNNNEEKRESGILEAKFALKEGVSFHVFEVGEGSKISAKKCFSEATAFVYVASLSGDLNESIKLFNEFLHHPPNRQQQQQQDELAIILLLNKEDQLRENVDFSSRFRDFDELKEFIVNQFMAEVRKTVTETEGDGLLVFPDFMTAIDAESIRHLFDVKFVKIMRNLIRHRVIDEIIGFKHHHHHHQNRTGSFPLASSSQRSTILDGTNSSTNLIKK